MLTLPADPYLALGVSREAQLPEIRTAYRKLVLKCHPDKIHDPLLKQQKQDEFQKVQQAYELLSNETEKSKYDDMYKLNELQKEMNRMSTSSSSAPRSSRRDREPEYYSGARVYTAEPRASTFASPSSKGYAANTPPSRSYEEFSVPSYEHHPPRKTASWEKRASREERDDKYERKSKKDDKRDREEKARKEDKEKRDKKEAERRDKERRKEKEERKEREEKERKEKKKKAEQLRKKEAEFKTQTQKPTARASVYPVAYSSDSDSDEPYSTARKVSGTREDMKPVATSERERKYSENMDIATSYLERSGARVSLNNRPAKPQATEHFQTRLGAIPMAAPTPPPPPSGPHAPPPPPPTQYEGDETLHRSSTTKSASRRTEKPSSTKKSTRASSRDPTSVEYTRAAPSLQKSHTMPPEYARAHVGRSHTEYTVRPTIGTLPRAHTFIDPRTEYPRDRSPTRHRRTHYSEDEEDSDDARRHRRSKHRSPERTFRYAVDPSKGTTRQVSHEEIPRQKSSKSTYHTANTSAPRMESGVYDTYPAPHAGMKVKYAQTYNEDDIAYSRLPHPAQFRPAEYVGGY